MEVAWATLMLPKVWGCMIQILLEPEVWLKTLLGPSQDLGGVLKAKHLWFERLSFKEVVFIWQSVISKEH